MNTKSQSTNQGELIPLRVAARSSEAEDIVAFRLVNAAGGDLPGFEAGAHLDVHTGPGRVRQYSLCNPGPSVDHYEIAVLKEPASRGGSTFMHDALAVGSEVLVSRPRNHFELVDGAPVLLFAGGIGITPLLAMAKQLSEQERSFELHYCARSRARAAFRARLEAASYADNIHFHFDDEDSSQRLDIASVLARATPEHHVYVCGPGGFIQHVLDGALHAQWSEDHLHREFFSAPTAPAGRVTDTQFELELARSGRRLVVPAEKSVLAVLAEAGVDVAASCEMGVCGTCVTRVIDGTPDHRDVYLTDAEHVRNDSFTPCCSRSRSPRLVIDL
ncbi:2Fe-2S iron-sulfur cluster-binding protein [Cupriavidus sp. 2TAF22]|uniref:PDR/VanB family oxidoreductase n=1 Tax=unclassified Cupriavidus TaxID=2640874 RepID=UPI003F914E2A